VRDIRVVGVFARTYEQALPEVAGTVGVSKSPVSRRMVEVGAEQLRVLNERGLKELKLLASSWTSIMWRARLAWTTRATSTCAGCPRAPARTCRWSRTCWVAWSLAAWTATGVPVRH
jgi:hypothetical protein